MSILDFIRKQEHRPATMNIAEVQWQLIPDRQYCMDEDGYGMTREVELNIYGVIDQEANSISKFHYYTDDELEKKTLTKVRKEAEEIVKQRNNNTQTQ